MDIDYKKLQEISKEIRKDILLMTSLGKSSHVGSSFSIVEILVSLYGEVMQYDLSNLNTLDRDRFILSKGHAGAALYSTLANFGFFSREILKTHCKNGSKLSGHVSNIGIPGVDFSTGSLGHGLPVATGIAYEFVKKKIPFKSYVLMSDGECDEGSNWEAILFAGHHNLSNLIAIVDYNKLQSLTHTSKTLDLEPFVQKWKSFNWEVEEVNGHSLKDLIRTLNSRRQTNKPLCLICHTVKGKGVSFMENSVLWHYRSAQGKEYEMAMKELENYEG